LLGAVKKAQASKEKVLAMGPQLLELVSCSRQRESAARHEVDNYPWLKSQVGQLSQKLAASWVSFEC
jgi:hypothetical protein